MLTKCSLLNTLANTAKNSSHARRYTTNVLPAPLSAVHRGINFEGRCITLLEQHLSMSLKRVGGKGDGGVDMLGWWWIPDTSKDASISARRRRIRVIAQCKAEKKKIGPKYIRELEGVLHHYHMSGPSKVHKDLERLSSHDTLSMTLHTNRNKEIPFLGLFISESAFTKATVLRAQASHIPLLLLHLPPEDEPTSFSEGTLGTAIWNLALAGDQGLLGGQMEIRWERCINGPNSRPGLWWRDERLYNWVPSEV